MKETLLGILSSASHQIQNLTGNAGGDSSQLQWILLAVLVGAMLLLIFAFDKPKTVLWLLILYTALFVLIQIPGSINWLDKNAPTYARHINLIVGAIPVVVIGVLKFKRKR